MAVVSKADRFGVDVVIENLQQSLYPRLLAYWDVSTVYTSYPRANKNYKKDNVIPEISLDQKDYKETLMDDKLSVNSFWLVENTRPYNTVEGRLSHKISVIFQADLVALYGQSNRADEEFNINVLTEIAKNNPYIFETDVEVIETIDSVYSDLTISGEMKDHLNLHDIGKLHVVRFDFEIKYDKGCNITKMAPVCPTITETFNGAAISNPTPNKVIVVQSDAVGNPQVGTVITDTSIALTVEVSAAAAGLPVTQTLNDGTITGLIDTPSGQNVDFVLFNEEDQYVVPIIDTNTANGKVLIISDVVQQLNGASIAGQNVNLTPKNIETVDTLGATINPTVLVNALNNLKLEIGDTDNQVNGVAKTAIPSGGSKNFVIQDSIGNPVTVTDVSDSASAYVGEVVAAGAFYYAIPQPTYNTSYNTYDEGWHNINGTYSNTIPVGGRLQALANGDFYKVQFDAETRGHLYRFLGLNGGYYNSDDGLYYDSSHVATTRALVFDTDRYAFDRLTGLALRTFRGGSKNLTAGIIDAEGASWNTFTDWHLPFTAQYFSLIDYTLTVPLGSAGSPIFSLSLTLKSCTPTAATPTVNGNQIKADGEIELTRGYASADSVVYIRDARGQF